MQENNFLEDRKQHINNTKKSMFNQLYLKHCRESKLSNDVSMYYFNMNITLLHMTFDTAICGIDSIYDEFNSFVLKKLRSLTNDSVIIMNYFDILNPYAKTAIFTKNNKLTDRYCAQYKFYNPTVKNDHMITIQHSIDIDQELSMFRNCQSIRHTKFTIWLNWKQRQYDFIWDSLKK